MGREYVLTCDCCGKTVKPSNGYYKTIVSACRVKGAFSNKTFYFCPECAESGCIGEAVKNKEQKGSKE